MCENLRTRIWPNLNAGNHHLFTFEYYLSLLLKVDVSSPYTNLHLRQQYVLNERIDKIIRTENLTSAIAAINHQYHLNLETNFSSRHHIRRVDVTSTGLHRRLPRAYFEYAGNKSISLVNVYNVQVNSSYDLCWSFSERIPAYDNFYSPASRKLVKKIYWDDFKNYYPESM
jgi:hypothetical protein